MATRRSAARATWLLLGLAAAAARADTDPASPASPGAATPATADGEQCSAPVCIYYDRLEAERNHIVLYQTVIIDTSRGTTRIKADQAEGEGLSPDDNRWVLTGHVNVSNAQAQLRADRATVVVAKKQISSMSAQGAPAEFERNAPGEGVSARARGHARQIDYDLEHQRVLLRGDSWLSDGCNELTGQQIQYDIANQRIEASAGEAAGASGRVHGAIRARPGSQPSGQCSGNRP